LHALVLLAVLPAQSVENPRFSWGLRQAAFEATAYTYHPASRSRGSAILVAQKGGKAYLLTAAHVVPVPDRTIGGHEKEDPKNVEISFYSVQRPDHVILSGNAVVIARMPNEDLAVLATELKNAPKPIPICPRNQKSMAGLKPPFEVLTMGVLLDGPPESQFDQVKDRKVIRKPDGTKALFWEAAIPQQLGRSGGAMIDADGYVIGIASGTEHGNGYYTHIDEIHWGLVHGDLSWLFGDPAASK
jgi:hypothetical protein